MSFLFSNTIKKRVMAEVANRIQAGEKQYEVESTRIENEAVKEIEQIAAKAKQAKSELADEIVKNILK